MEPIAKYTMMGHGSIKSVDGHRWYLDESNVIHLVEMACGLNLAQQGSRLFGERKLAGVRSIQRGKDLRLDTGEVYILVNSLGGDTIEMSHLPTGDPDSSFMVRFYQVRD